MDMVGLNVSMFLVSNAGSRSATFLCVPLHTYIDVSSAVLRACARPVFQCRASRNTLLSSSGCFSSLAKAEVINQRCVMLKAVTFGVERSLTIYEIAWFLCVEALHPEM